MLLRLDADSRKSVHRCAARLGLYAGFATCTWLLFSGRSLTELADTLQLACTLGALVAIGRACRLGKRVNADSLNLWDEGMALNCLSLGIHIARRTLF